MDSNLRDRIMNAEEAVSLIKSGMTVAFGGQVAVGCPKAIPRSLAKRGKQDLSFKINVLTTSNNMTIDDQLAECEMIIRRYPMNDSRILSKQINAGNVSYCEQQMHKMPKLIREGFFGEVDVCIVEAIDLTEDGYIIPTTSVGIEPTLLEVANSIIIEINRAIPSELNALHDICMDRTHIYSLNEHIGINGIKIDIKKVIGIVYTNEYDTVAEFGAVTNEQLKVCENLLIFLDREKQRSSWLTLPPIQTGFGNLAAQIIRSINDAGWKDISFYAGHLQESNIQMILEGKVRAASCSSIQLTPDTAEVLRNKIGEIKRHLVIRNAEMINNPIITSYFSPITLTSGIEIDIYGNMNLSHISGTNVVNGLGGGANFSENAGISIAMIVSEGKQGNISTIVPMVTHQDICEHDIDIVITENGIADLRGKDDIDRARLIIENCSGSYKEQLFDYYKRALKNGGHHPALLNEAFSWHAALKEKGSMRK